MRFCFAAKLSFNTQPPEGGWIFVHVVRVFIRFVSTHSRPKAAGRRTRFFIHFPCCFNTQPPEGGWL